MNIRIFTDGACSSNPGPGGYAALIATEIETKTVTGFNENTTNNRMELLSVIKALEEILNMIYQEDIKVININLEIISDSAYVVNAINLNWLQKWRNNNFKNTDGKDIKNIDLWKKLMSILDELFFLEVRIKFTKIKGHNGNYFNEMVDQLAKEEIKKNVKKAGI